jgi:hypothetical protein
MSENERKIVTIHLTQNQAEALFCVLRHSIDDHFMFNNNNGLTFLREYEERMENAGEDYEELDCDEMNKARMCAAWQVYSQLTPEAQKQHQGCRRTEDGIITDTIYSGVAEEIAGDIFNE